MCVSEAKSAGLLVCDELEALQAWVRGRGLDVPQFFATHEEAEAKGLKLSLISKKEPRATRIAIEKERLFCDF